jgi:hypothetical protein
MATYNLVNQQGAVVNTIDWDGVTPYQPPPGFTLALVPPPIPSQPQAPVTPPVPPLTAAALAAALITKGVIAQSDINAAVQANSGAAVQSAIP